MNMDYPLFYSQFFNENLPIQELLFMLYPVLACDLFIVDNVLQICLIMHFNMGQFLLTEKFYIIMLFDFAFNFSP